MPSRRRTPSLLALSALVALASACGGSGASDGQQQDRSGGDGRHAFLDAPCSGDSDGMFTSKVTDVETLHAIYPAGGAAGWEIKPHGYFLIEGDQAAVYAPVDMELVQGALYHEQEGFLAKTTYILHFAVGCNFAIFLDHITDPVDRIKDVLNAESQADTRLNSFLAEPISFKAGELIGYTLGAGTADSIRSFDFGYYSADVTNQFANQDRYVRSFSWKQLHAVCAFDYFAEPLRSDYFKLFSARFGAVVPNGECRSPNRDVPGTLSGSWFFTAESYSVEPHVAIASDIDGASLNIAGLKSKQYFTVSSSNPTFADPATVTDRHCYQEDGNDSQHFYFVLVDDMTLDIYEGSGTCPAEPSGTKITLYR